jgi:mono/diheme cytochrome c family protein
MTSISWLHKVTRTPLWIALLLVIIGPTPWAQGETPSLLVEAGGERRQFTAADLLANPATLTLAIPQDASYGRPMNYRAIPLRKLLRGLPTNEIDTNDGFVSQLPWSLIAAKGGATPWIAIEDPSHPWPHLERKPYSAGPFYLVWENPERSGVTTEQWPYALASLTVVPDPLKRWPQLSLGTDVPSNDPARRGQAVFLVQCLPCHRLRGAGEGTKGPNLGQPMPAVAYFTEVGLRKLMRDPAMVRTWPQQQMPRFDPGTLSDADIDAVIAYLRRIATPQH